jgi:CRP-like cAMP-binding protein
MIMDRRPVNPPHADILERRLSSYVQLSPSEISLLQALPLTAQDVGVGVELISEGKLLDTPRLLLDGWACRFRMLPDGRRQIFDFILPGDLYGLCLRPQAVALTTAMTLTRTQIADASALWNAVSERVEDFPGLANACYMTMSLDEAHLLNQLVRVGRQTAYERTAHLILEIFERLNVVGLAEGNAFPMPLTQETIADALGLSVVHLNRTLQQLRRDQLIEFRNGFVRLLKPEALADVADFRPPIVSADTPKAKII